MGGFGSLIAGLGQGAQKYGEQQRNLNMQQWGLLQSHLADALDKEMQRATTPERLTDLSAQRVKVLGARPGDDNTKLFNDVMSHISLHPTAAAAFNPQQSKGDTTAGVPMVGQPSGTGSNALTGLIGTPPASAVGSSTASSTTLPAAQPQTSLVSPAAQGGGVQPSSPQSPAPTIAPVPQALPQAPIPDLGDTVRSRYNSALASGTMPQALQTAVQPFLTNSAELERTKMLNEYLLKELGPERLAVIKQSVPNYDNLPGFVQAGYAATAMGVPAISVPGMAMQQQMISTNTPGVTAPTGQLDASGEPIDRSEGTRYRVVLNRMDGMLYWYKQNPEVTVAPTPGGAAVFNKQSGALVHPLSGAVPAAFNTPHLLTLPDAHEMFQTAAGASMPTPGVNPSMATASTTATSTPTMEGGTASSRTVTKTMPGATPARASTPPVGGVPASGGTSRLGVQSSAPPTAEDFKPENIQALQKATRAFHSVRPFDPRSPLDKIVRDIAQDAANWKEVETKGPFGPKNPRKSEVTARMAELQLSPNNVTGSVRDRAAVATTILPHLDDIESLLDQAQRDGDMGLVMTRLNKILTGDVGDDPTKGKIFSKLYSNLDFVTTAVGMAHGGARAGSSLPIIDHWSHVIGAKDPDTLRSQLGVVREWVNGYAQMAGDERPVTPNIPPVSGSGARPPLDQFFKK